MKLLTDIERKMEEKKIRKEKQLIRQRHFHSRAPSVEH